MNELNNRARIGYVLALAVILGISTGFLARAAWNRREEIITRRETWPYVRPPIVTDGPPEEGPAIELVMPATTRVQVVARLREIRRKAGSLHPTLDLDSPPVPGSPGELDGLMRDLIADLDPEADPPAEEARP